MNNGHQTKLSVILCTYNSAGNVKSALDSLNSQTFKNFQLVVQDNKSTDDTIEIIQSFEDIDSAISIERDAGIYDALNRALKRCDGDIITILHSDDMLQQEDTYEEIVSIFEHDQCDLLYGDLSYINSTDGKLTRSWKAGNFAKWKLWYGWMPPHPAMFVQKSVVDEVQYDTSYKISGDYDWFLQIASIVDLDKISYYPRVVTLMRIGGTSNGSIGKFLLKKKEDARALKRHGFRPALVISAVKSMVKLFQFPIITKLFGKT